MTETNDPIPVEGIYLLDAFEQTYRAMHPDWADLESRLGGVNNDEARNAWNAYDQAQLEANRWLRGRISEGALVPLVRDPQNGKSLQISRQGWDDVGLTQSGISSNFVAPNDPMNPGPDTEIDGKPRTVFFLRCELVALIEASFAPNEQPAGRDKAKSRGKVPLVMAYLKDNFPEGVPVPAFAPRKALRDKIIKALPVLGQSLDEQTLKNAIDHYNGSLPAKGSVIPK